MGWVRVGGALERVVGGREPGGVDDGDSPVDARTVTIRLAGPADVVDVAHLHKLIAEGFLTTLGERFLRRLYRTMTRSEHSFVLVAEQDGAVIAFMAATTDTGLLYRSFLRGEGLLAAVSAAPRLLWRWRAALETLRYDKDEKVAELPRAELLSAAVAPAGRGQGIGRTISVAACDELQRRGVTSIRATIAAGNHVSLSLYRSLGFRDVDRIEIHRGTPSVLLRRG